MLTLTPNFWRKRSTYSTRISIGNLIVAVLLHFQHTSLVVLTKEALLGVDFVVCAHTDTQTHYRRLSMSNIPFFFRQLRWVIGNWNDIAPQHAKMLGLR